MQAVKPDFVGQEQAVPDVETNVATRREVLNQFEVREDGAALLSIHVRSPADVSLFHIK